MLSSLGYRYTATRCKKSSRRQQCSVVPFKKCFLLQLKNLPQPSVLDQTIEELGLGTYSNMAVARLDTPIIDALSIFLDRRISAVPIVDENNKLTDIYSKFDAIVSWLSCFLSKKSWESV